MLVHWYKDLETHYKLILAVDWYTSEDRWYMIERARYDEDIMEELRLKNLNRHRWFNIVINICSYTLHIEVKLNKVGLLYYGRFMHDGPRPNPFNRIKEK